MVTHVKDVDPRVKRTRQLLQQALQQLMQDKSFASITIQDIAERATVNRATFYAHFEDKYDLLECIIRERFEREVASQLSPGSRWGINALRVLIGAVFDHFREMQSQRKPADTQLDLLFEQIVQEELSELLLSWLKQVPASETGRRVPAETMALVMSWEIFGAAAQWSRGGRTSTSEQLANQVLIVITQGLARLIPDFLLE